MLLRKVYIFLIFFLSIFSKYATASAINITSSIEANVFSNTIVVLSTGNASGLICNGSGVKLQVTNGGAMIEDYVIEWYKPTIGAWVGLNGSPTTASPDFGQQITNDPDLQPVELSPITFNSGTFGNQFKIRLRYWVDDVSTTGISRNETNSAYSDEILVQFYPPASVTNASLIGNDQELCINGVASGLTISNTVGTKYVWDVSSTGPSGTYSRVTTINRVSTAESPVDITLPSNLVNTSVPGIKYYKASITNGDGCTVAKNVFFTVVTKPNSSIELSSGTGTNSPTVCINTQLTNIVYTTSNVTGVRLLNGSLPPGVTLGNYATNATSTVQKVVYNASATASTTTSITASTTGQFTLSGTPTAAGTYTYTIVTEGLCASTTTTGTITVLPDATLDLVSGTSTPTICINNPLPTPIIYQSTSTASEIKIIQGSLPGGLNGFYNNSTNQFTISGTATESGVFNYTIATFGGCITATQSGTITVNPDNTIQLSSGTDSQTVCINNAITPIEYTTTGATGANFINLPAGVTGLWAGNIATISGTATESGTFTYTVELIGGCASITATGVLIVNPDMTITWNATSGATSQGVCINTSITPILYTIGNASDVEIVWDQTPPLGVSYAYDPISKSYTISGTSSTSGVFNYTLSAIGGCGTATASGSISFNERYIYLYGGDDFTLCQNVSSSTRLKVYNASPSLSNATFTASSGINNFTASYNQANQILTITGTPSQSGTFTFTVTSTDPGGCDPKPLTSSFTFNVKPDLSANLISGTNTPTLCINDALSNDIIYQINNVNANDIISGYVEGLPIGMTGVFNSTSNQFVISGVALESGIFNYQVTINGGCNPITMSGVITVNENKIYLTPAYYQNFENLTTPQIGTLFVSNPIESGTASITTNGKPGNAITLSGSPGYELKTLNENLTYGIYEVDAKAISIYSDQSLSIIAQTGTFSNTVVRVTSRPNGTDNNDYSVTFMGNMVKTGVSPVSRLNWYKIKVSLLPNSLKVWIGNTLVYERVITNEVIFTNGAIILSSYHQSAFDNLKYAPIDTGFTECIRTNITPIVYETENSTGASITSGSLPAGLTGEFNPITKQFIISGVATESGTFTYTISTNNDCNTASTTGTITIKPDTEIVLAPGGVVSNEVCVNTPLLTPIVYTTNYANRVEITAGNLPPGISGTFSATTQEFVLSGTATQSGIFSYSVTAYGDCASATTTGTITVKPDATISLVGGSATTTTCINTAITPIQYQSTSSANNIQINAGRLPGGLTSNYDNLTKQFIISGTATESGTFTYTIVTSGDCNTATTTGTITVDPATSIDLIQGTSTPTICINNTLATIVYESNYTASDIRLISGNFPGGITGIFNPITKQFTISGTATQSGTFTYTIATVGICATSTASGTIIVNPLNTIVSNGTKNATTCINTSITPISYNTTGATGAIYTYIDQNNVQYNGLPSGIVATNPITNGTITISGTPTTAGTFTYTVTLIGGCGSGTVAETGVITVNPDNTITLTSPIGSDNQTTVCINTAIQNITYSTTSATGAFITYTNTSQVGTFSNVTGLNFNFNPTTKVISLSGTPTVAGDYDYTITLTGGCGNISLSGKIYVKPNKTITINSPGGTNSQTVCINNNITPISYTFTNGTNARIEGLPNGVLSNVVGSNILIEGAPTVSGTFNYLVSLDGCGSATATGTIVVNANSLTLVNGSQNIQSVCLNATIVPIVYQVVGATQFNVTGLTPGLGYSFNPITSQLTISGTVSGTGAIIYTISTLDGCNTVTANGTINVTNSNTIVLTSPVGTDNQTEICINAPITEITYATTGATGAQFSYSVGSGTYSGMPPGIIYSWSNNVITIGGSPTQSGLYTYRIELLGGCNGGLVEGTMKVNVNTITATTNKDVTTCVNTSITNIQYKSTGATGAVYSYTDLNDILYNGLPPGLIGTDPDQNGIILITGTPTMTGIFRYKVTLIGGCGSGTVFENGVITVNPENTMTLTSPIGSNNQTSVCVNTGIQTITYQNTGATGTIESYTLNSIQYNGLPPGLQRNWTNGVLTISGAPTLPGNYNYTITQTGGCFPQTASGQIIVKPNTSITLSSAVGTNNAQSVCINTAITSITYSTTSTNLVNISSGRLPNGLTQVFDIVNQTYTISGTPSESGTFTFTILAQGDCSSEPTSIRITIKPDATINLIQGTSTTTTCVNTAIVTPIIYQSENANNVTITGLPAGLTGTFNSTTNQFVINGTATVTGTYTYTVVAQGDCLSATSLGTIIIKPDTRIVLNTTGLNEQELCINTSLTNILYTTENANTVTITGLPAGLIGTFSSTTQTFIISGIPTQSGSFTYTISAVGDCLGVTSTGTINVKPDATLNLIAGTLTATECINNVITPIVYRSTSSANNIEIITGSLPSGLTGIYNNSTKQFMISGTATESGTFTYTIATSGACVTSTATGTITIKPDTRIVLNTTGLNEQELCINTSLTNILYTTENANTVTITGLPSGLTGTFSSTTQTFLISGSPIVSGTFTYTISAVGDCLGVTTTGTIIVNENQINLRNPISETCINTSLSPIVYDIVYADNASLTGILPLGVNWAYNSLTKRLEITGTPTESGTFTFTISTIGGCATKSVDASMTVNPDNTIVLNTLPSTINQVIGIGSSIQNIIYTTTGATNVRILNLPQGLQHTWNNVEQILRIYGTANRAETATYTVVLEGGCGDISTTGFIDVKPNNTITLVSSTGSEACINTPNVNIVYKTTLATNATINGLPNGLIGSWLTNGVDSLFTISGTPIQSGTFNYSINLTGGYGNTTLQGVFRVDQTTVAGNLFFSSGNSPICNTGEKPAVSIKEHIGNTIVWQYSNSANGFYINTTETGDILNAAIDNSATGLNSSFKYYRASVKNGACAIEYTDPIEIEVIPSPIITNTLPAERCGPGVVELSAASNLGLVNWYDTFNSTNPLITNTNFITPSILNSTEYYVGATYRGCPSLTKTVVLARIKVIPEIASVVNSSNCGPGVIILGGLSTNGVVNWYNNPVGGSALSSSSIFKTPLLNSTTTYFVDAELEGCITASRTPVVASIFNIPIATALMEPINLCVGNRVDLKNNASNGASPYTFSITASNQNVNGSIEGDLLGVKEGLTELYFNVKDANGCISPNSDTFSIKIHEPVLPESFNYQAFYMDNFIIPTKMDSGYVTYNWVPSLNLNFNNKPNPTFNGENTIDYQLSRMDTTSKCVVIDNYHIDVTKDFIFNLPNAFTPNYDGINDEIKIIANSGIEKINYFKIFNRNGNLVFQTTNIKQGWDGRIGESMQDSDAYFWIAEYVTKLNQVFKKNGSFLLLK